MLAHVQQQFAKDLDPASSSAPHTLGDMTDRLKVSGYGCLGAVASRACTMPSLLLLYKMRSTVVLS
jgi:hypothetical protein